MNQQPINTESIFSISRETIRQKQILLDGYNELIRLLETPGNIDKQTLMQSIGRTLKNAAK